MKVLVIALLAGTLSACTSVSTDMANNRFPMIQAEKPPSELVGIWTGAMSSYLTTIKIEADGTGTFCYSWGTADVEQKIKYNGGRLQIQDGTNMTVADVTIERLSLRSDYFTGGDYSYVNDKDLSEASTFCESALRE